jgi:hypothetical protein
MRAIKRVSSDASPLVYVSIGIGISDLALYTSFTIVDDIIYSIASIVKTFIDGLYILSAIE